MDIYTQIVNDQALQARYHQIGQFEDETGGWAYHNWDHVQNVTRLVTSLLQQLHVDSAYLEAAKIASILHDVGALEGKEGHALRGREFAASYFAENHLQVPHEQKILSAIACHSGGFEQTELMTLALIFSDKLDITKTRVAQAGYDVVGMRQLQYIQTIDVTLDETTLRVDFVSEDCLNQEELQEFYFMQKVFRAIDAFALCIERTPCVYLNNVRWDNEKRLPN